MPFPTSPRHLFYSCFNLPMPHLKISTIFPYGVAGTPQKPLLTMSWASHSFPRRGRDLWPHRGTAPCFIPRRISGHLQVCSRGRRPPSVGQTPPARATTWKSWGMVTAPLGWAPCVLPERAVSSAYCGAKDQFQSLLKKTLAVDSHWMALGHLE